MSRYTIDRFEDGAWGVLEDEQAGTFRVPRHWLPSTAREGDVVDVSAAPAPDGQLLQFRIDAAARRARLEDAARRRADLPRGPKGDVSL